MNTPELEPHLARLAPRRLPASWKSGILAGAEAASPPPRLTWRVERVAWSAVAAVWVLILGLRVTTPSIPVPDGPPTSAAQFAEHRNQIRHYASLEIPQADSPSPARIHLEQEFILPARPRS